MHVSLAGFSCVALVPFLAGACLQRSDSSTPSERRRVSVGEHPAVVERPRDAGRQLSAASDANPIPQLDSDSGPIPPRIAEPATARVILIGQVQNARDLGGTPLADAASVAPGMLFRGPPLANLSDEGCAEVAALGIRSVIDLRIESEVSFLPDSACALEQAQLVAAPLPVPYNTSPQDYIADLDASESIAQVFRVLGNEASYPVYFHCTWGRDRTGILAAVILLALAAGPETIMADYLVSRATVGVYPASLQAALDEIAQRGGVDAYLAAAGVAERDLQVLRARAIR